MKKIRRIFALALAAVLLGLLFTACSGSTGESGKVDLSAIKEQIINELDIKEAQDIGNDKLCDLYGISEEDIASAACFVTMGGTFPEEALMVEAANGEALDRIKECLEWRLEDVLVQSRNYDVENYALVQTCSVLENGNYFSLFVSAKHTEMEKIFENAFNK